MTDVRSAPTTARNPYLPTAARWLAGILIVLVIAAGATYSYRQQAELRRGRAEWEAEVARIRESGQPLTAAELQAYGKIPDGEDLTQLYLKALAGCTSDYKAAGDLPIVGSGNDDIPMPPQPWPQLEQAEAYLKQYRGPLQDLSELGERRGAMRIDTEKIQQLQDVRSAIRLLQLQCAVRTHRQDYQGAADSLIAMHRLPEALRYQVTGNAQVFRVAFSRVASWQVVPLVQDPEFPQSELQRVQEALRETDWQNALLLSCLSERSRNYELVQQPVSAAFPQAEKEFRFSANFILLRSRPGDAARVLRIHSDYVDAARSDLPTVIASFKGYIRRCEPGPMR